MNKLWLLLIRLLNCKSKDYTKGIVCGDEVFIVKILKHTSPNEELEEWENALGEPKA